MRSTVLKNKVVVGVVATAVYISLLIADVPFIRGIYDPVMPSNWPYYYVPTWGKVWLPCMAFFIVLALFSWGLRIIDDRNIKKKIVFFSFFILAIFLLHLSYVFFSRFGITVLFQRTVNPGMNGYFSSAMKVDTSDYLTNFPMVIESLDQHARDHPPGSILLVKAVNAFVNSTGIAQFAIEFVSVPDGDVRVYWDIYSNSQRVSAILVSFLYHFFGALTVLFFYLIARFFFNNKTSLYLSFWGGLIPSVSFFALKFDTLYLLLLLCSVYFFIKGVRVNPSRNFLLAGLFTGIGLFFSYSIIPALGVAILYTAYELKSNSWLFFYAFLKFFQGLLAAAFIQVCIGFNPFTALFPILGNQAPRSYLQWLIYNPFDFFQYFAVPLAVLWFYSIFEVLKSPHKSSYSKLQISFLFVFILLILSGISRAEVGRIWMPLMIFPLIGIGWGGYLTPRYTIIIGTAIFIQNIIMTEFWVPVW